MTGCPQVPSALPVLAQHVLVGRGRDYADVSPLRGIYTGGGSSALGVSVAIERLR